MHQIYCYMKRLCCDMYLPECILGMCIVSVFGPQFACFGGSQTACHAVVTCRVCVGRIGCDSTITFDPCTVTSCWPAYRP